MDRKVDPEVASILQIVRMCLALNTLPGPGGLLDQDSYFVFLVGVVMEADAEKQRLEDARARMKGRH